MNYLLVVEAGERSGALITAGYALEQDRKVFAVPNSIYSLESFGTNRLLQKGAEVYLEPKQLVSTEDARSQHVPTNTVKRTQSIQSDSLRKKLEAQSSPQERLILERLNSPEYSVGVRDFLDIFDGNLNELLSLLCSMELEGKVVVSGQTVSIPTG